MMAEKIRNVLLKIIGFVTGMIATIVAVYFLGTTALLIIIIGGCITLAISGTHKNRDKLKTLEKEMEHLKNELDKIKDKH